jgi:Zonular occludens toxin (Zot)
MSISFITGKPGGGKGLLSMQQIVDELVQGKRHVICNTPVRIKPWIFGDGKPMIGLQYYLVKKYGKDYDCEKRVHILDDDQIAAFFLWRVVDGKLVKAEAETTKNKDGDEKVLGFDTTLASHSGGVLYVVDEAWKFYSSRSWQKTGEGALFYSAQHRHFGDDVFIVTQHTKQIDPAIQRVAQDFWVVKNHSKMSIGIFRQPDIFSVAIYDQAPTGAQMEPMTRKVFTLDKKGLAQTYDTSSGVGLTGRFAADVGGRKKGLPWWGIIVVIIGIGLVLWYVLLGAGKLVGHAFGKAPEKVKPVLEQKVTDEKQRFDSQYKRQPDEPLSLGSRPAGHVHDEETNEVFCFGYSQTGHHIQVFLSDGRVADSLDGDVQMCSKHKVTVFGETFKVSASYPTGYVPNEQDVYPLPVYNPPPVNQAEVTVIGQSYRDRQAPQRVGGFASMPRNGQPNFNSQASGNNATSQ